MVTFKYLNIKFSTQHIASLTFGCQERGAMATGYGHHIEEFVGTQVDWFWGHCVRIRSTQSTSGTLAK